jgi:DNA-binding transcriptional LysR family regulator
VEFHAAYPNIDIKLSIGNSNQVAAAVSSGATAISRVVVRSALQLKSMHAAQFTPLERPLSVLRHRDRSVSSAARALLATIQNYEKKRLKS